MVKYTHKGSDELHARIDRDLKCIAEHASAHAIAGILLGGYGRGEGTPFINSDGTQSPFNDYDLIVIVEKLNKDVRHFFRTLEEQLTKELGLTVDLYPYLLNDLSHAEFSLLNYEMKYGHKVIWGDENILKPLPDYAHERIPPHEGARLLLNRGKLLLDIKSRLEDINPLTEDERILYIKFIQKIWLALGDAALLLNGQYDLSYAVKKQRIKEGIIGPASDAVIKEYIGAVELKDWGNYASLTDFNIEAEYQHVRSVFLEYFQWYRTEYRNSECSLLKAVLLNLRYNGRPLPRHPRLYLYDALTELLQENPCKFKLRQTLFSNGTYLERFHWLRRRFS